MSYDFYKWTMIDRLVLFSDDVTFINYKKKKCHNKNNYHVNIDYIISVHPFLCTYTRIYTHVIKVCRKLIFAIM